MQQHTRAVLFANGCAGDIARLDLRPEDFLVAVDNGYQHLKSLNLFPNLLIGDLDSIPAQDLSYLQARGVEILRFPPAKDQTDLELALEEVQRRGFRRVMIACPFGGRLDHSLGNLAILSRPDLEDLDVCLEDGIIRAKLICSYLLLNTSPGDIVSLLPWEGDARDVSTTGLLYPLRAETLYASRTRGISNVAEASQAEVMLGAGKLLLFHYPQSLTRKSG